VIYGATLTSHVNRTVGVYLTVRELKLRILGQESLMNRLYHFERLKDSAGLITRHPDFPGKAAVIEECAAEINAVVIAGSITGEQGVTLLDLHAGSHPRGHDDTHEGSNGNHTISTATQVHQRGTQR
jgi:hypothetical protein